MKLIVPRSFADYLNGKTEIMLEAENMQQLRQEIKEINPALFRRIFDEEGKTRVFVKFFLGKHMVNDDNQLTEIKGGEVVTLVSAVAGG